MAKGTRLKDLSEHIIVLESKMQKLSVEYQEKVLELTKQIAEVSEVEQKHNELLQVEATRQHEAILHESTLRHEELLPLLNNQRSPLKPVVQKG